MSELVNTFPFPGMGADGGLDIGAIFGEISAGGDTNPFDPPPAASPLETASNTSEESAARTQPQPSQAADIVPEPTPAPAAPADEPEPAPAPVAQAPEPEPVQEAEADSNPIAAAFTQQAEKNTQQGLLEKPPVFCYKNVKEPIEDADMSFEELRIRKSDDFTELEEGKSVSWSVEYCGIRKEIRDPKGTTIRAMKESIERSREFLDALKKAKGKASGCCVRPKVTMKSKGVASYKGTFQTVEEARASDKVICLIPSGDGRLYELRKTEQGEFIAPKNRVGAYQQVRAGFIPALPLIPLSLMGQIIAFFRGFMTDGEEYEALALIYWDKDERRYFVYVPRQTVEKEGIEADLRDCPYDDNPRYIRYADIHSHNSMDAFFSSIDDMDERGTGLYLVIGHLEKFFPDVEARISCGGSFCAIDPGEVIEGLAGPAPYPAQWRENVTPKKPAAKPRRGFRGRLGAPL